MITVTFENLEDMQAFAEKVHLLGWKESKQEEGKQKKVEKEEAPQEDEVSTEAETVQEYALEDVRAALAPHLKNGKREKVQALIQEFGAEKLTDIKEGDYASLMQKAGEL